MWASEKHSVGTILPCSTAVGVGSQAPLQLVSQAACDMGPIHPNTNTSNLSCTRPSHAPAADSTSPLCVGGAVVTPRDVNTASPAGWALATISWG